MDQKLKGMLDHDFAQLYAVETKRLKEQGVANRRQLYRYLRFYRLYPEIVGTLSPQLRQLIPGQISAETKAGTPSPQLKIAADTLIQRLSYSHIEQIADIEDPIKRVFYEIESLTFQEQKEAI